MIYHLVHLAKQWDVLEPTGLVILIYKIDKISLVHKYKTRIIATKCIWIINKFYVIGVLPAKAFYIALAHK